MTKTPSKGVAAWGWLLILGSVYQMLALASGGYPHYAYLFQQYSPQVILLRYWVSWIIKIIGLAAGIGVLKLNEWCRKLAVFNSFFVVLLVSFKHPYEAYALHAKYLDQSLGGLFPFSFSSMVWPALIIQRSIDVIFGIALIHFFTRPGVKKQFTGA
ncbi:MAG: hypothetical protein KGK03_01155 [Candidatus Omnitrophica bacterium]|nr:hypothetical protein [Candidatus Omnitrophota bacterium]MDE2221660.1 hypothetical protein [Candidatus Omnitrophota bacterium]